MATIKKWISNNELFQEKKEIRKAYLSAQCQEAILRGFQSSVEGTTYHFSYDREAQTNLQERWQLFQNDMVESLTITAHTLDGEDVRLTVNKEQFNQIYLDSVKAKEDKISRLRDVLYPLVDEAISEEQLNLIDWGNEMVFPKEPSIKITDERTLDKQVKETSSQTAEVKQNLDITSGALMELTMLSLGGFGGGI